MGFVGFEGFIGFTGFAGFVGCCLVYRVWGMNAEAAHTCSALVHSVALWALRSPWSRLTTLISNPLGVATCRLARLGLFPTSYSNSFFADLIEEI